MSITEIYWLTRVVDIAALAVTVPAVVATLVCIVALAMLLFNWCDSGSFGYSECSFLSKTHLKLCKKAAVISGIMFLLLLFASAFIPSKSDVQLMVLKQLAAQDGILVSVPAKSSK